MTAPDLIRRLHEHRRWANRRALDACRPLTDEELRRRFEIGQGTVLATLAHLYAAEFIWLAAIEGNPSPPPPSDFHFASVSGLESSWAALDARWEAVLARLTDADLTRPVAKRSTSSGAGRVHVTPLADVLLHVPLHAQYTLAQLANMLRQLGRPAGFDAMLITMSRAKAASSDDLRPAPRGLAEAG